MSNECEVYLFMPIDVQLLQKKENEMSVRNFLAVGMFSVKYTIKKM